MYNAETEQFKVHNTLSISGLNWKHELFDSNLFPFQLIYVFSLAYWCTSICLFFLIFFFQTPSLSNAYITIVLLCSQNLCTSITVTSVGFFCFVFYIKKQTRISVLPCTRISVLPCTLVCEFHKHNKFNQSQINWNLLKISTSICFTQRCAFLTVPLKITTGN